MAKNWTTAEAVKVVIEGTDKAAIQDIGRRFPLFLSAASRGIEGLLEIIGALPDHQTARKIEATFKEGVGEVEEDEEEVEAPAKKAPVKKEAPAQKGKKKPVVEDEDDEEEEEEAPKKKAPAAKGKPTAKGKAVSKKPVVEEEDDEDWDEDEDEDEVDYDSMSLSELRKAAKAQKINGKGLDKDGLIAALKGEEPDEDEDDDDDWDI